MERKDFKFTLDDMDEEKGVFTGYASIWGVLDSYGDVVEKGAFKKTLLEQEKFPMLWSHDVLTPIGVISAREDRKGLSVDGHINLDVQRGREVRSLMKQGAIKGLSIGYKTVKSLPGEDGGEAMRRLKEVKLYEISPVVFPACEPAQVEAVKAEIQIPFVTETDTSVTEIDTITSWGESVITTPDVPKSEDINKSEYLRLLGVLTKSLDQAEKILQGGTNG